MLLSDDKLRIIFAMLICIPLSSIIPKIPYKYRQLYSLVMGTIIQYFIYGPNIVTIFFIHTLMYYMTKLNPQYCGKHVTIVSLALLSVYHVYRMVIDYGGWTLDLSTIMMSNVNKYSLFAYAYQDGQTDIKKLSQQQLKQRQQNLPSFFRFLGYCQFLPGSPLSTAFPYKYYENYIQLKQQYEHIPSPWKKVGLDVGYSLVLSLVYLIQLNLLPLETMKQPQFTSKSFWFIIIYSMLCVSTIRFKYYSGWKLSMGAIHASGISYQQHGDNTSDFNLIKTCNPQIVQSSIHIRQKIGNWNMTCQQWLRKCIYERYHFRNKIYGQLLTFMVSAFWHGFYGGYYISFFLWFVHVFISQLIFKETKKQNSKLVKIYQSLGSIGPILLLIASNVQFTLSAASFVLLSFHQSIQFLKSIYFFPFIFPTIIYLAVIITITYKQKQEVCIIPPQQQNKNQDQNRKMRQLQNNEDKRVSPLKIVKIS